jgi:hypothetical protein
MNDEQQTQAAKTLISVKANAKNLKAKKSAILDPLKASVKEINALFKPAEDHLAEIEQAIKAATLAYHEAKEAAAQKQIDRIERRMDKGTLSVENGIAKLAGVDIADSNLQVSDGTVQFKNGPAKVRIIFLDALIKARPELLKRERVIEALRMEVAADIKAGAPVPDGAEVYRERTAAVRV